MSVQITSNLQKVAIFLQILGVSLVIISVFFGKFAKDIEKFFQKNSRIFNIANFHSFIMSNKNIYSIDLNTIIVLLLISFVISVFLLFSDFKIYPVVMFSAIFICYLFIAKNKRINIINEDMRIFAVLPVFIALLMPIIIAFCFVYIMFFILINLINFLLLYLNHLTNGRAIGALGIVIALLGASFDVYEALQQ